MYFEFQVQNSGGENFFRHSDSFRFWIPAKSGLKEQFKINLKVLMCQDVNSGYLEKLRGEWQLTLPLKKKFFIVISAAKPAERVQAERSRSATS